MAETKDTIEEDDRFTIKGFNYALARFKDATSPETDFINAYPQAPHYRLWADGHADGFNKGVEYGKEEGRYADGWWERSDR